jgi:hypothetical protein
VLLINPIAGLQALVSPERTARRLQTQSGFTHVVQFQTNLAAGISWLTYSNVVGDGSLKTVAVPYSVFSPFRQGFIRVLSH